MKILKGTLVTHTYLTGNDGQPERGKVVETCPDADVFMVRVRFEDDKRSRWETREELVIHRNSN